MLATKPSERLWFAGRLSYAALYAGGVLVFVLIWTALSFSRPEGPSRVPAPIATFERFWTLMLDGTLPEAAWTSTVRVAMGFGAAAFLGTALGFFAGVSSRLRALILPVNSFLRYIPPTALVVLLVVYFGLGELFKYAVVFVGVFFFIVQMTIDIMEDLDERYVHLGQTSGLVGFRLLTRVHLPASMPRIVDMWRANLAAAWTFLVAAEIIGSTGGLGHFVVISQRFLRIEDVYAGLIVFGLIGISLDFAIQGSTRLAFRWHSASLGASK